MRLRMWTDTGVACVRITILIMLVAANLEVSNAEKWDLFYASVGLGFIGSIALRNTNDLNSKFCWLTDWRHMSGFMNFRT
jgi:hypothetical protein